MHFEKVTREQWTKDMMDLYQFENPSKEHLEEINRLYDDIQLPKRATKHSAGYDFYVSGDVLIPMEHAGVIPTGIRWVCDKEEDKNKVLQIYPRSGIGFRTGVRLMNTVGIIDADYWEGDNEGHIMLALLNTGNEPLALPKGECVAQGIFYNYLVADGDADSEKAVRGGGFGSTSK